MKYAVRRKAVEKLRSRPARGAWVEIHLLRRCLPHLTSRPARGAWVEMLKRYAIRAISVVAPRKGRVG